MNDVGKELKKDQLDRNNRIRSKIINSFDLSDEIFIKKYYCDRESLFQVCLPYFQSQIREKTEKKFKRRIRQIKKRIGKRKRRINIKSNDIKRGRYSKKYGIKDFNQ